jgi:hypothetical protein
MLAPFLSLLADAIEELMMGVDHYSILHIEASYRPSCECGGYPVWTVKLTCPYPTAFPLALNFIASGK